MQIPTLLMNGLAVVYGHMPEKAMEMQIGRSLWMKKSHLLVLTHPPPEMLFEVNS